MHFLMKRQSKVLISANENKHSGEGDTFRDSLVKIVKFHIFCDSGSQNHFLTKNRPERIRCPPTPEETRDSLSFAKGDFSISCKKINNLKYFLKNILQEKYFHQRLLKNH